MNNTLKAFIGIVLALVVFSYVSLSKDPSVNEKSSDGTVHVLDDDILMNAAIKEARETIPDLLKAVSEGVDSWSIKVPLTEKNITEHVWLVDVTYENRTFTGTISNQPQDVSFVTAGQMYSIKQGEISDWMYRKNGVTIGNRTLKAAFNKMTSQQIEELKRQMGWK